MNNIITAGNIKEIPVDQIQIIQNIRDDTVDLEDLQASIKAQGLLQPIIAEKRGSQYHLVTGHRRYRACKALGWETIPALVHEFESREMVQLTENLQRKNLSRDEEANVISRLFHESNQSQEQFAALVGHSTTWVSARLVYVSVRDHLINECGMTPTQAGNLTFDMVKVVVKYEKKFWEKMCRGLFGRRWDKREIEELCETVAGGPPVNSRRMRERAAHMTTASKIKPMPEGKVDPFSIIPDNGECIIKVLCSTQRSYNRLLVYLMSVGGEVI